MPVLFFLFKVPVLFFLLGKDDQYQQSTNKLAQSNKKVTYIQSDSTFKFLQQGTIILPEINQPLLKTYLKFIVESLKKVRCSNIDEITAQ